VKRLLRPYCGYLKYTMTYNPDIHHRRSIRLRDYDYSAVGAYFVTICAWNRECLFGDIMDGSTRLNDCGTAANRCWQGITTHLPHVELDVLVIMPNHFHAILHITESAPVGAKQGVSASPDFDLSGKKGEAGVTFASPLPPHGTCHGSLGAIIQNFKSVSTRKINKLRNNPGCPVWQRNYYERVIRNDDELTRAREYIMNNPLRWDNDENNPAQPHLAR